MTKRHRSRTIRFTLRLTHVERDELDRRAAACRLSTSAYIRRTVLEANPRARQRSAERAVLRRLDTIRVDLDTIATAAQEARQPAIEDALLDLGDRLDDARSVLYRRLEGSAP